MENNKFLMFVIGVLVLTGPLVAFAGIFSDNQIAFQLGILVTLLELCGLGVALLIKAEKTI